MYDSIIVGAGPAGMTAALYLLRSGKSVLLLESDSFGGQIASAPNVENYPGIPNMDGSDFADKLLSQVTDFGADIDVTRVGGIVKKDGYFDVITESGAVSSKTVIIAVGVKHRTLGIVGEENYFGKGISFCAVCDGPFYKGKTAAIVGGGNSALQEALYLSEICETVHLIHRRDTFRAESSLVENVKNKSNIILHTNSVISAFKGADGLEGLTLTNNNSSNTQDVSCDVLFEAIGRIPENKIFADIIELDANGYVISDEKCHTSCPGVFVAGDCRQKTVRQLTTALADGSSAALAAVDFLN